MKQLLTAVTIRSVLHAVSRVIIWWKPYQTHPKSWSKTGPNLRIFADILLIFSMIFPKSQNFYVFCGRWRRKVCRTNLPSVAASVINSIKIVWAVKCLGKNSRGLSDSDLASFLKSQTSKPDPCLRIFVSDFQRLLSARWIQKWCQSAVGQIQTQFTSTLRTTGSTKRQLIPDTCPQGQRTIE